jgi:hypothetical protein
MQAKADICNNTQTMPGIQSFTAFQTNQMKKNNEI